MCLRNLNSNNFKERYVLGGASHCLRSSLEFWGRCLRSSFRARSQKTNILKNKEFNDLTEFTYVDRARIHKLLAEYQKELETVVPVVVICGAGKCDVERFCEDCDPSEKLGCIYDQRKRISQVLNESSCISILFEEDFDLDIASIEEQIILRNDDVEIVFIIPSSVGSAAELALFARDPIIKPKLRVLVPYQHHPLYAKSRSFLTSHYLELMSELGHIYPFDPSEEHHPSAITIASMMMDSYRLNKLSKLMGQDAK